MSRFLEIILVKVIKSISPELKNVIKTVLDTLEQHAKKTTNPYDDIFVELLKSIFE